MKTLKPLSQSAKNRMFRQCQKAIAALEHRLVTCPIEQYDKVKSALNAEREALKAYIS